MTLGIGADVGGSRLVHGRTFGWLESSLAQPAALPRRFDPVDLGVPAWRKARTVSAARSESCRSR
jgi:hypothetical protein